jgi:hypothetical protein
MEDHKLHQFVMHTDHTIGEQDIVDALGVKPLSYMRYVYS